MGLWRQKRYAWAVVLGLYVGAAGVHAWRGPLWSQVLLALVLAAGLFLHRRIFFARSHPPAVRAGAQTWAAGLALALLIGTIGLGPRAASPDVWGMFAGAARAGSLFALFNDPLLHLYRNSNLPPLVLAVGALSWLALWRGCERSMPPPAPATPADRSRARAIVRAYGHTSMAHLTLLPDKCYFFTDGGTLVAYGVYARVALALGDPIGPPEDAVNAVHAFREFCILNDWLPAFCLTTAELLPIYTRAGFDALCLGHEGVIDLTGFHLRGNLRKTLRKRYNRLTALGYQMVVCEPTGPPEILAEVRKISDEWLGMARAAEKRFFLAWFDEELVRGERLALVYAPDGTIIAFTTLTPEYQLNEVSIDLMRRRRGVESGVLDFLFVSLLLWLKAKVMIPSTWG